MQTSCYLTEMFHFNGYGTSFNLSLHRLEVVVNTCSTKSQEKQIKTLQFPPLLPHSHIHIQAVHIVRQESDTLTHACTNPLPAQPGVTVSVYDSSQF